MKPLAAWTRDLVARVDQLEKWATTAHPPMVYWMSGFTFPTGFLTAVLQSAARQNNVSQIWHYLRVYIVSIALKHINLFNLMLSRNGANAYIWVFLVFFF